MNLSVEQPARQESSSSRVAKTGRERRRGCGVAVVCLLYALAGCGSSRAAGFLAYVPTTGPHPYLRVFQTIAIDGFTAEYRCPRERVAVEAQPVNAIAPPSPPQDVAGDPERLAIWNQQVAAGQGTHRDETATFAVTGCGHAGLYSCNLVDVDATGNAVTPKCFRSR